MSKTRLFFAVSLEPDFTKVDAGETEPYRVNVPALDFNELAELLEREVKSVDKISVRCANDYLDIVTLHGAESRLNEVTVYCKHTIAEACSKPHKGKAIDIRGLWSERLPVLDRSEAAPPGMLFFAVSGSSLVSLGVWMTALQMCFGRARFSNDEADNNPMHPPIKAGIEGFFGMPFKPIAYVFNLGPAE